MMADRYAHLCRHSGTDSQGLLRHCSRHMIAVRLCRANSSSLSPSGRLDVRSRSFKLGEETVTLPRGTRVILKTELRGEDGVALTGIHLLLTGEVVTNVVSLYEEYECPNVLELVQRKRSREKGTILEGDEPRYLADLARLERVLEGAASRSVLPEAPVNRCELEDLIVATRLLL